MPTSNQHVQSMFVSKTPCRCPLLETPQLVGPWRTNLTFLHALPVALSCVLAFLLSWDAQLGISGRCCHMLPPKSLGFPIWGSPRAFIMCIKDYKGKSYWHEWSRDQLFFKPSYCLFPTSSSARPLVRWMLVTSVENCVSGSPHWSKRSMLCFQIWHIHLVSLVSWNRGTPKIIKNHPSLWDFPW